MYAGLFRSQITSRILKNDEYYFFYRFLPYMKDLWDDNRQITVV